MATFETHYQNYLKENPHSTLTYEEWYMWLNQIWVPEISDNFQIGPDGAFEHKDR